VLFEKTKVLPHMNPTQLIRRSLFASAFAACTAMTCSAVSAQTPTTRQARASTRRAANPVVVTPARPDELEASRMRSPQDTIAAIKLPEGYHLELVASEPDIMSPVLCNWDGNGRMYVAELRSYMLDINGSKEKQKVSRVIRLEDTKGNGSYDKLTVLADNLMLPRMVLPLDDRILVRETDTKDIYAYRDVKGDGKDIEKTLFFQGGPVGGNLEHQASGLMWNIDNWIYTTVEPTRYRYTRGKVETEKLNAHMGQWGLAFDDTGRTFFNTAGGEDPGFGFQVNPVYADVRVKGEQADGFVRVFPLLKFTDVQGGPQRLSPGGGLNHFTGCAGGSIYRGDALPADLEGDYILPEPVGRLIRRAKVVNEGGKLVLKNAYENSEFFLSADANFRPVWTATGPDGCLYICDMYHGIIQESEWTKEGSYLRPNIQKYGLDKHINAGRIYRLVYDGMKRREQPHMLDETPTQLVKHLSDANGWWRDTAQKLIILRHDRSVVPAILALARTSDNALARLHALWTLEGLDAIEPAFLAEKLQDADPRVRAAAVRIAEPLFRSNDASLAAAFKSINHDPDPNVAIQYCVSLLHASAPQAGELVKTTLASHSSDNAPVVVTAYRNAMDRAQLEQSLGRQMMQRDPKLAAVWLKGRENFLQTCIACHGVDGKGAQVPGAAEGLTLAPPLKGSKRLMGDNATTCRIVLHGLTGPNDGGKVYPGEMAGFPWADDEWLSSIVTYARNAFGNHGPAITPKELAAVRGETATRNKPYTLEELKTVQAPAADQK
jgi:mono/diheme cytochrome c family protein/glucose/arabinose dehydrogenase